MDALVEGHALQLYYTNNLINVDNNYSVSKKSTDVVLENEPIDFNSWLSTTTNELWQIFFPFRLYLWWKESKVVVRIYKTSTDNAATELELADTIYNYFAMVILVMVIWLWLY